jgi:hypothetical protein
MAVNQSIMDRQMQLGKMRELACTASDIEVSNIEQIHSGCGAIFHKLTWSGLPGRYDSPARCPWAARHISKRPPTVDA